MRYIKTWNQKNGISIDEIAFDGERGAFVIYIGVKHVVTVYADSPEQTEEMRASLHAGEDVRDWEDGDGNSIGALIAEAE